MMKKNLIIQKHSDKLHYTNIALKYADDIIKGRIKSNEYVKLQCKKCVKHYTKSKDRVYHSKYAEHICHWIESYIVHIENRWAGENLKLSPSQIFILAFTFGFRYKDDESKRFNTSIMMLAGRKSGKSLFAASILSYCMAFSDVNEQHYTIATTKPQAMIVWKMYHKINAKIKLLRNKIVSSYSQGSTIHRNGTECRALHKNVKSQDGFNPKINVFDEVAAYADEEIIEVILTGQGAVDNHLNIYISTATANQNSAFLERLNESLALLKDGEEDHHLTMNYTLDQGDEPFEEANWIKANPNLDIITPMERFREMALAAKRGNHGKKISFFIKNLNIFTNPTHAWSAIKQFNDNKISIDDFKKLMVKKGKSLTCTLGLDFSQNDDLTSLVFNFLDKSTGIHYVTHQVYYPMESLTNYINNKYHGLFYDAKHDGYLDLMNTPIVSQDYVTQDIKSFMKKYSIKEICLDVAFCQHLMQNLSGVLKVNEIKQTMMELTPTIARMEELVAQGKIRIIDDPFLLWQLNNSVVLTNVNGLRKIIGLGRTQTNKRSEKVDSISAMINSFTTPDFIKGLKKVSSKVIYAKI